MASLDDLGLTNAPDDEEELRAKALDALVAQPDNVTPSDLDANPVVQSAVPSSILKRYLVDPQKQIERDDIYARNQMLVGGLRNFLSPKSGEAHLKAAESIPVPEDRMKGYADILGKYNAARKSEADAGYLGQDISPAIRAKYEELGIPLPEKATYGSLASQQKALDPIFKDIQSQRKLQELKQILDYKGQQEQGRFERGEQAKRDEERRKETAVKRLSPEEVQKVKSGEDAIRIAEELEEKLPSYEKKGGPVEGALAAINPYDTAAQEIDADLQKRAQVIGLFMEGGKLQKADEEKYKKMLPTLRDTPAVRKAKAQQVRDMLVAKQKGILQGLTGQNYSLEGFRSDFRREKVKNGITYVQHDDGLFYPKE